MSSNEHKNDRTRLGTSQNRHSRGDSRTALLKRTSLRMVGSRTPVAIEWKSLNYAVEIKDPDGPRCCGGKVVKTILHNVSGKAKSGELVAIMGPSGSGKTTLLNTLAGRIIASKGSSLTGSIKINGIDRNELGSKFARIAAYVQQDDVLFSMQTVRETLLTAALFRLPKTMKRKEKEERVDAVIQELGLNKCQNTFIGDAKHRGVSGGERKRTNIGVELIQDPSLIFLDEPTSGLDSFSALSVVETLKVLATSGCTIITSIHQPRSSIYQLFDRLILLSEGHIVYDGKAGRHAVQYFNRLNYKCPSYFNPADYFLDLVAVDGRTSISEKESKQRIEFLVESHDKYIITHKDEIDTTEEASDFVSGIIPVTNVRSSVIDQLSILFARSFRQLFRDKLTLFLRLFMSIFFSGFLSAVYSGTNKSQKSFQSRSGILFFISINQSFGALINVVNTFAVDKAVVTRERQAKSYHLINYYITKVVTSLPVEIFYPLIFSSVLYFAVNLHPSLEAFASFIVIAATTALAAQALGFIVGAVTPTVEAATALAVPIIIITILFGGFYINDDQLPVWLAWLQNVSTIRWSFVAFMINEFQGVKNFKCPAGQEAQCFDKGSEYLERFSFDKFKKWEVVGYLLALTGGFHICAYLLLRKNKPKYLEVTSNNFEYYFKQSRGDDSDDDNEVELM